MSSNRIRVIAAMAKWFVGIGALLALMIYLAGFFTSGKIESGWVALGAAGPEPQDASVKTVRAEVENVPVHYEAVGSVRSRQRFEVAAQTAGRILEVKVREGNRVEKDALLARIESDVLEARREQARQAREAARAAEQAAADLVTGAEARFERARAERSRVQKLLDEKAATPRQMETAESEYRQAEAGVNAARARLAGAKADVARADGQVREAEVALAYTEVRAPTGGEVVHRRVDPGDLAWTGRPLIVLHDPRDLRLEAGVREGLIKRASLGARVKVRIEALELEIESTVEEIVPSADPLSRTFLVKAGIPYRDGLLSGMFGRLRLTLGQRRTVLLPFQAVRRIGQLEQVRVVEDRGICRRFVRTGLRRGDRVEVLSGLSGGERVVVEEGARDER